MADRKTKLRKSEPVHPMTAPTGSLERALTVSRPSHSADDKLPATPTSEPEKIGVGPVRRTKVAKRSVHSTEPIVVADVPRPPTT